MCILSRESERLISHGTYYQFRTREYSMAVTSMKTPLFVAVESGQLRAVRQSRFACLYLENRFATNVSKLIARIR